MGARAGVIIDDLDVLPRTSPLSEGGIALSYRLFPGQENYNFPKIVIQALGKQFY
jgi:hypothetical protein